MISKLNILLLVLLPFIITQDFSDAEIKEILAAHNVARAAKCQAPLTWDPKAASVAKAYAATCPSGHNPNRDSQYLSAGGVCDTSVWPYCSTSILGENIAWMTAGTMTQFVNLWVDEEKLWSCGTLPSYQSGTGHYTQVVWEETIRVGCGRYPTCNGLVILVCNYFPPGNFNPNTIYAFPPKYCSPGSCTTTVNTTTTNPPSTTQITSSVPSSTTSTRSTSSSSSSSSTIRSTSSSSSSTSRSTSSSSSSSSTIRSTSSSSSSSSRSSSNPVITSSSSNQFPTTTSRSSTSTRSSSSNEPTVIIDTDILTEFTSNTQIQTSSRSSSTRSSTSYPTSRSTISSSSKTSQSANDNYYGDWFSLDNFNAWLFTPRLTHIGNTTDALVRFNMSGSTNDFFIVTRINPSLQPYIIGLLTGYKSSSQGVQYMSWRKKESGSFEYCFVNKDNDKEKCDDYENGPSAKNTTFNLMLRYTKISERYQFTMYIDKSQFISVIVPEDWVLGNIGLEAQGNIAFEKFYVSDAVAVKLSLACYLTDNQVYYKIASAAGISPDNLVGLVRYGCTKKKDIEAFEEVSVVIVGTESQSADDIAKLFKTSSLTNVQILPESSGDIASAPSITATSPDESNSSSSSLVIIIVIIVVAVVVVVGIVIVVLVKKKVFTKKMFTKKKHSIPLEDITDNEVSNCPEKLNNPDFKPESNLPPPSRYHNDLPENNLPPPPPQRIKNLPPPPTGIDRGDLPPPPPRNKNLPPPPNRMPPRMIPPPTYNNNNIPIPDNIPPPPEDY